MKGTEKQIKWAIDIIEKADEAIQRFELNSIKKEFELHEDAAWFIENYRFTTDRRETNFDQYKYFESMLNKELELRTAGMKRREANQIGREVFRPMFDEIYNQYVG